MLIKSKYFLDIPRKDGNTALCIASYKKESIKIVRMLTEAGAGVNLLNN